MGNVQVNLICFFAPVDYRLADAPVVYVLPSADVFDAAEALHRAVSVTPPSYKDIGMRNIHDPWIMQPPVAPYEPGWLEKYNEQWLPIVETRASGVRPRRGLEGRRGRAVQQRGK
ncbi:MAG: hypothetical protein M0Z95_01750 [Actinomycetota bacterium]|nr:hypothetical protein [Actinomycetota bacterium]